MIWLSEVLSGLLFESDVADLRSTRERGYRTLGRMLDAAVQNLFSNHISCDSIKK